MFFFCLLLFDPSPTHTCMAGSYGLDSSSRFGPIFYDVPVFLLFLFSGRISVPIYSGDGLHGIVTSAGTATSRK